ncbi:GNAT family N-acetyltransferase [Actinokineospora bangkokensis]|uniref:N-acetyltransferase domain-containing protein n=1 Tax=Actinokineospora bangkokensis TaxID=1193682 RepID=A0A1Q9LHP3_9PSEU|nr:GNAT family N-acetyltransferase [Actinokineospora bangkokensis]OLR91561.1 hypothetical protein BJP25_25690 [Actinokineospora bangkokensis]
MYATRPATAADRPAVVELVARLQADPAQHIGYHGTTAEEVEAELAGFAPDWAGGAALAVDDAGAVRGVLSVDADPVVGRAWLHGPFVELPDGHPVPRQAWHNTADDLLDTALRLPRLTGVADLELFGHRKHRLLADFAARHGFDATGASRVFALTGAPLRAVLVGAAPDEHERPVPLARAGSGAAAGVAALHERCFPNRTVTGHQLVTRDRGHTVVVLTGVDGVLGYAAGYPQEAEHYVDYVAVDPDMRGVGTGQALVRALLRELAAASGPRPKAAATISLGNDASERMFAKLGFELELELAGYRRR